MSSVKECTKCNLTKARSEFSKGSDRADGLQYICKSCVKKESTARNAQPGYMSWLSMKQRTSPKHPNADYYYNRGISVHKDFMTYAGFISYMGNPPTEKHTIERIDNDGNYEPGNVRWATIKEQQRNRRSNKYITYGGETLCYEEWGERLGASHGLVWSRLKMGWSEEDAVTVLPGQRRG